MEAHETEEDLDDQFDSMIKMNDPFLEILIPEGEPSIYSAIRYGDDDMVKRQIHEGVDLNRKFEGIVTILHLFPTSLQTLGLSLVQL
jgi:hypothetical protein